MSRHGWIGVDLDGTLAEYDGWQGEDHIGDPVPVMLARVKAWLDEGRDVRIFTARASRIPALPEERDYSQPRAVAAIEAWCERHLGVRLPVTNEKDYLMVELWDDRAVQIIPNTGRRADGRRDGLDRPADFAELRLIVCGRELLTHPSTMSTPVDAADLLRYALDIAGYRDEGAWEIRDAAGNTLGARSSLAGLEQPFYVDPRPGEGG